MPTCNEELEQRLDARAGCKTVSNPCRDSCFAQLVEKLDELARNHFVHSLIAALE